MNEINDEYVTTKYSKLRFIFTAKYGKLRFYFTANMLN